MRVFAEELSHLSEGESAQRSGPHHELQCRTGKESPIQLLWFNLECPEAFKEFKDPARMRATFYQEKELDNGPNPPSYIKLW